MTNISEYWRHEIAAQDRKEFNEQIEASKLATPVWPVWHRTCKDIAFFLTHHPHDKAIESKDVRLFSGRRPSPRSPMVCESCGQTIKRLDLLGEMPIRSMRIQLGDKPWHRNVNAH